MECSVWMPAFSAADGRRHTVRQLEDYMRGTQRASGTTQTPLNTSLSHLAAAAVLPVSPAISIAVIVLCANEDKKHHLSPYVSSVKDESVLTERYIVLLR